MSGKPVRRARGVAAVVVLVMMSACSQQQDVALCDGAVEHVEVFNIYADHEHADRQEMTDPEEIAFACADLWTYQGLQRRDFAEDELSQRATTILVLRREDETTRTVWAHRLVGVDAGTAVLTDDGGSFLLPNQGLPHYYGPDSDVVSRESIPEHQLQTS